MKTAANSKILTRVATVILLEIGITGS